MTDIVSAQVIEDTVSNASVRLLTMQLRYPRIIHAEFMTHRVFSRNARSSRAVPTARLLTEAPYIPHFMMNQPGMQALQELDPEFRQEAEMIWRNLAFHTQQEVQRLHDLGVHKQWANRPLEWFGFIDVLITSTDWHNFFHLRDHEDAQPEIQALAKAMRAAFDGSEPREIGKYPDDTNPDDWHLPYILDHERRGCDLETLKKMSVARCARISYKPFSFESQNTLEADVALYEKLVVSEPLHASPAEHQAVPDEVVDIEGPGFIMKHWANANQHGNLVGWRQFRKMLPNEAQAEYYRSSDFFMD